MKIKLQELLAIGTCNIVGSFFRCFVTSGAISRSTVQVNAGGVTQVSNCNKFIDYRLTLFYLIQYTSLNRSTTVIYQLTIK